MKKIFYRWYSICSRHYKYDKSCDLCNTGGWIFIPGLWLSKILYKITPNLWGKFYNTKKSKRKFLNNFRSKKTGEKINPFPHLKS